MLEQQSPCCVFFTSLHNLENAPATDEWLHQGLMCIWIGSKCPPKHGLYLLVNQDRCDLTSQDKNSKWGYISCHKQWLPAEYYKNSNHAEMFVIKMYKKLLINHQHVGALLEFCSEDGFLSQSCALCSLPLAFVWVFSGLSHCYYMRGCFLMTLC